MSHRAPRSHPKPQRLHPKLGAVRAYLHEKRRHLRYLTGYLRYYATDWPHNVNPLLYELSVKLLGLRLGDFRQYPPRELRGERFPVVGKVVEFPSIAIVTPSYNQGHVIAQTSLLSSRAGARFSFRFTCFLTCSFPAIGISLIILDITSRGPFARRGFRNARHRGRSSSPLPWSRQATIKRPSLSELSGVCLIRTIPACSTQVVDGGSTDETMEVLARYRNRLAYLVSEPDSGQSSALVKGLARIEGGHSRIFEFGRSADRGFAGLCDAVFR
jgi:hypothetical protein